MITSDDIALVVPVERSFDNTNWQKKTSPYARMYEDEAVKCFSSWRKNGGWLKDISIYAVCITKNTLPKCTQNKLLDLGVKYIEDFDCRSEDFSSGFLTLPYTNRWAEQNCLVKERILLRADLDMYLLKPLPKDIFDVAQDKIVVGQYDEDSAKDQRTPFYGTMPFDTGLMIYNKASKFGSLWCNICESSDVLQSDEWKKIKAVLGDYYLEEFAVDYIYHNKLAEIFPVQKYQFGEGYASIDTFSDEQLNNLWFLHEHIYVDKHFPDGYDSITERIKYLKRRKATKQ